MITKLLSFSNVVAGGTATVSIPCGPTYRRFLLQCSGTTFNNTHITEIRYKINGRLAFQVKGADLIKMNAYYGLFAASDMMVVDFSELFARDQVAQNIGAIPSIAFTTYQIEVDISGTAVGPVLNAWVDTTPPRQLPVDAQGRPIAVIEKLLQYTSSFAAGGKFNLPVPIGAVGSVIKRIYFFHTNLTALEIKKNGIVIHDTPVYINQHAQKENKHTPQAGLEVWDTCIDWNLTDMVSTTDAAAFELNVTVSAADTIRYLVEYIDPVGNL